MTKLIRTISRTLVSDSIQYATATLSLRFGGQLSVDQLSAGRETSGSGRLGFADVGSTHLQGVGVGVARGVFSRKRFSNSCRRLRPLYKGGG